MKHKISSSKFAAFTLGAALLTTAAAGAQVFNGGNNRYNNSPAYSQDRNAYQGDRDSNYGRGNDWDQRGDGRSFNQGSRSFNGDAYGNGNFGDAYQRGRNNRFSGQDFRTGDRNWDRRGGWDRDDYRASDRGPNTFDFRRDRDRHHHRMRERFDDDWGHRHNHPFSVGNHGSRFR